MIALPIAAIHHFGAVSNRRIAHSAIMPMANRLARRETAPSRSQSRIIGPNCRCASNQACRRREPRAAANAASSTNGTVGKPGTTMPTMPMPRLA